MLIYIATIGNFGDIFEELMRITKMTLHLFKFVVGSLDLFSYICTKSLD